MKVKQAFRGRRSLYPENIVQMFQLAVKEQIIRFVAAVSGNDIFSGIVRVEMVQHGMQCFPFIRILSGLDDNIQKGFADNINEAVKVHMVIPLIVDESWLAVVLNDFGIGSINHMAAVTFL